jgi:hypothetical protein
LGFQLLEEQISTFQSKTSVGGLSCPDLLFHPVSGHLEASSSRAKLLCLYSHPEGCSLAKGVWIGTLEGKKLILYLASAYYLALGGLYLSLEHFVATLIPVGGFI